MIIKPKWLKHLKVPDMLLGGQKLKFTQEKKYLGCFICNNMSDNTDIKRQIRCLYTRGNILIKKFRHCSEQVKLKLFSSYCSSFYGCTLWGNLQMLFIVN